MVIRRAQVSAGAVAARSRPATYIRCHEDFRNSRCDAGLGQCSAITPWHPASRLRVKLIGVPQQHGEIVKRVDSAQLRSVDQAHKQIAHLGPVLTPVEQGVLAVQNRFLQGTFTDIMPTPGLCRVSRLAYPHLRRFSDSCGCAWRHNHKLSRKASKVSRGRKRAGTSLDGLACANARSLSCMSACRYI